MSTYDIEKNDHNPIITQSQEMKDHLTLLIENQYTNPESAVDVFVIY